MSKRFGNGKLDFTRLNGIVYWASVLIEVICWIGAAACTVMLVLTVMAGGVADRMPNGGYGQETGQGSFGVGVADTVAGFTFTLPDPATDSQYQAQLWRIDCVPATNAINGMDADQYRVMLQEQAEARAANPAALLTLIVLQLGCAIAMALVMHNIRRISQVIQSWLDRADLFSPFDEGFVESLNRIGWLLIAMPVVAGAGSLLAVVLSSITGRSNLNISPQLSEIGMYLMVGALALLIAHVLDYGSGRIPQGAVS